MTKLKLCYLVSSLANEGPVNVIYNIVKYIDFSKFEVSIVTFIPEKDTSRLADFRELPIEIYQLSPNKQIGLLGIYKRLKAKLTEIKPDELHAHCPRSLFILPYLPQCYKKIYTIHIFPGEQQLKLYGKIKGKIVIELDHYFTKKCDLAIGCAENVGWQYKEEKGWEIKCIPNGSSLPVWEWNEAERQSLRKEFGMKEDVKYFIFIGRFSQEKNPDVLFDSFNGIERKDVGLVMLGNGPMWEIMKAKCPENIIMPGFTTRVYDYLKAVDFYISASDVEGLANTILESMSIGMPMLLSDIPSHREVLSNLPDTNPVGYIIKRNSIDIREKIDKVLLLNHKTVSKIMRELYQRKYTAEVMSKSYQREYINLMEG